MAVARHGMDLIAELKKRVPSPLQSFVALDTTIELPGRWKPGRSS
jgi:hypothetical protein